MKSRALSGVGMLPVLMSRPYSPIDAILFAADPAGWGVNSSHASSATEDRAPAQGRRRIAGFWHPKQRRDGLSAEITDSSGGSALQCR